MTFRVRCRCGQSNCSGCGKSKHATKAVSLLKFSGRTPSSSEGATITSYLADVGRGAPAAILVDPVEYPTPEIVAFRSFSVNLVTPLPANTTATIAVLKNGTLISGLTVAFGGTNPTSGVQRVTLSSPATLGANVSDVFSVRVVTTGILPTTLDLTAAIGVQT